MSRKLAICYKPEWFLREPKRQDDTQGYPIYYRAVISCSIAYNIFKHQKDIQWVTDEVENLMGSFNGKSVYEHEDFLELYPFTDNSGFVLVDKTNSCYPLIIYGARYKDDSRSRIYAFEKSLTDVHSNLELVYAQLSKLNIKNAWTEESEEHWLDNWTQEFQKELRKIFKH